MTLVIPFFVSVISIYIPPKSPFEKGGLVASLRRAPLGLEPRESPPFQRRVWEDCKHNPNGVHEHPEPQADHRNEGMTLVIPFFVSVISIYIPPKSPFRRGGTSLQTSPPLCGPSPNLGEGY